METQDVREVYRGHIDECIRHFGRIFRSQLPKWSQEAMDARKPIADFCGVSSRTVGRWFKGEFSPVGDSLFKLMCFLDAIGYKIIELERMPTARRGILELIGFGILTDKEAAELLGYSAITTLSQVLRGTYGTSEDKDKMMWDIWKARKEELEKKKVQDKAALLMYAAMALSTEAAPQSEEEDKKAVPVYGLSTFRYRALIRLMQALLLFLEEVSIAEFIERKREVNDSSVVGDVLKLSARLSDISSVLITDRQEKGADEK